MNNEQLTNWGQVMHICVGNLAIIGSDNGLLPGRCQAITWTNVGILLIGPLGTNFSEMLIKIHTFVFKKIHLKMSSGKWRPFCLGLSVLTFQKSCVIRIMFRADCCSVHQSFEKINMLSNQLSLICLSLPNPSCLLSLKTFQIVYQWKVNVSSEKSSNNCLTLYQINGNGFIL